MTVSGYSPGETRGTDAAVEVRRFVNDEIYRRAEALTEGEERLQQFVCECGDLTCTGVVEMSLSAYRRSERGSVVGHG